MRAAELLCAPPELRRRRDHRGTRRPAGAPSAGPPPEEPPPDAGAPEQNYGDGFSRLVPSVDPAVVTAALSLPVNGTMMVDPALMDGANVRAARCRRRPRGPAPPSAIERRLARAILLATAIVSIARAPALQVWTLKQLSAALPQARLRACPPPHPPPSPPPKMLRPSLPLCAAPLLAPRAGEASRNGCRAAVQLHVQPAQRPGGAAGARSVGGDVPELRLEPRLRLRLQLRGLLQRQRGGRHVPHPDRAPRSPAPDAAAALTPTAAQPPTAARLPPRRCRTATPP